MRQLPLTPPTLADMAPDTSEPLSKNYALRNEATLVMRELRPSERYTSPFNLEVRGFRAGWWNYGSWWEDDSRTRYIVHLFSFYLGSEEVARVLTLPSPHRLRAKYINLDTPCEATEVQFFEVRADLRRHGIGRAAAQLVAKRYPDKLLFAFSSDANEFWGGIGWTHHPRIDGRHHVRPLFALDQRLRPASNTMTRAPHLPTSPT